MGWVVFRIKGVFVDIDWDKPYGVIYGNHDGRFEQDGVYFDIHGKEVYSFKRNIEWAKEQKGLGGRNLLMHYAKEVGIDINNDEKINSVREKVIAHMS